jgi:hypothetical protein
VLLELRQVSPLPPQEVGKPDAELAAAAVDATNRGINGNRFIRIVLIFGFLNVIKF